MAGGRRGWSGAPRECSRFVWGKNHLTYATKWYLTDPKPVGGRKHETLSSQRCARFDCRPNGDLPRPGRGSGHCSLYRFALLLQSGRHAPFRCDGAPTPRRAMLSPNSGQNLWNAHRAQTPAAGACRLPCLHGRVDDGGSGFCAHRSGRFGEDVVSPERPKRRFRGWISLLVSDSSDLLALSPAQARPA
jgi:hypothetical protein